MGQEQNAPKISDPLPEMAAILFGLLPQIRIQCIRPPEPVRVYQEAGREEADRRHGVKSAVDSR